MSAWLAVSVKVEPDSRRSVLVVADLVQLFRVAVADRRELPEILKLILPRERHLPWIAIESPALVSIPSKLF